MENTITCLLVDDDIDDQEIFYMALADTALPVNYFAVRDYYEAIAMLNDSRMGIPDFVFIDWNLSNMCGKDCLVLFQQIPKMKDCQYIIQSGVLPMDWENIAQNLSCRFIQKSGSIAQFSNQVKSILESSPERLKFASH
ncbi:hypothetical protein CLV98_104218 [Dyadobacter jejuensis]|uniref:Response regulator receiver domain-containing protein n=1 Tax=Dyadobacter jejuensis TaxID=1082580 RepID=A0A316AM52_9BACT|nr:hypothetical protein [Dyadobacter jejuensis]PWJ58359.1 hypothetical protein CLV98_104218 [Dyadobacter jejuensis]